MNQCTEEVRSRSSITLARSARSEMNIMEVQAPIGMVVNVRRHAVSKVSETLLLSIWLPVRILRRFYVLLKFIGDSSEIHWRFIAACSNR